jgi:hypothetical protein
VVARDVHAALPIDGDENVVANPRAAFLNLADVDNEPRNGLAGVLEIYLPGGLLIVPPAIRRDRARVGDLAAGLDVETGLWDHDFNAIPLLRALHGLTVPQDGNDVCVRGGAGVGILVHAVGAQVSLVDKIKQQLLVAG